MTDFVTCLTFVVHVEFPEKTTNKTDSEDETQSENVEETPEEDTVSKDSEKTEKESPPASEPEVEPLPTPQPDSETPTTTQPDLEIPSPEKETESILSDEKSYRRSKYIYNNYIPLRVSMTSAETVIQNMVIYDFEKRIISVFCAYVTTVLFPWVGVHEE